MKWSSTILRLRQAPCYKRGQLREWRWLAARQLFSMPRQPAVPHSLRMDPLRRSGWRDCLPRQFQLAAPRAWKYSINGSLAIDAHATTNVAIGSIEGSGNVFTGANNLSVGGNNLSTSFSGFVNDNGAGGALSKTGTGVLTFENQSREQFPFRHAHAQHRNCVDDQSQFLRHAGHDSLSHHQRSSAGARVVWQRGERRA